MLDELTFRNSGRSYDCKIFSGGVSAVAPARVCNAMWHVEVDGIVRVAFEAGPDDTAADVRRRVIGWDEARRLASPK